MLDIFDCLAYIYSINYVIFKLLESLLYYLFLKETLSDSIIFCFDHCSIVAVWVLCSLSAKKIFILKALFFKLLDVFGGVKQAHDST